VEILSLEAFDAVFRIKSFDAFFWSCRADPAHSTEFFSFTRASAVITPNRLLAAVLKCPRFQNHNRQDWTDGFPGDVMAPIVPSFQCDIFPVFTDNRIMRSNFKDDERNVSEHPTRQCEQS
jgi:hypothetical protein